MPALDPEHIKSVVAKFVPKDYLDNPFIKALLAGATTIAVLLSTPAYAPIGVVGATGWIVVKIVTGGTLSIDLFKKAWDAWRGMGEAERKRIDEDLKRLKEARDNGALTDEEYRQRAQEVLDRAIRLKKAA